MEDPYMFGSEDDNLRKDYEDLLADHKLILNENSRLSNNVGALEARIDGLVLELSNVTRNFEAAKSEVSRLEDFNKSWRESYNDRESECKKLSDKLRLANESKDQMREVAATCQKNIETLFDMVRTILENKG